MTKYSIVPRRTITLLIVHCTATPVGREVSLAEVDQWHRQRGWKGIGYHYLIRLDGTVERGRPEAEIGAHCQNHNAHSLGICYVGGLDNLNRPADTRTPAQRMALREIRHDSIPYEVRIVEPSSPRLFPSLPQSFGWIALILGAGLGYRLLGRFLRLVSPRQNR